MAAIEIIVSVNVAFIVLQVLPVPKSKLLVILRVGLLYRLYAVLVTQPTVSKYRRDITLC